MGKLHKKLLRRSQEKSQQTHYWDTKEKITCGTVRIRWDFKQKAGIKPRQSSHRHVQIEYVILQLYRAVSFVQLSCWLCWKLLEYDSSWRSQEQVFGWNKRTPWFRNGQVQWKSFIW
jgi:hypothetical protein